MRTDEMSPGRDLDVKVAELMGWKQSPEIVGPTDLLMPPMSGIRLGFEARYVTRFSTDVAAFMGVWREMHRRKFWMEVASPRNDEDLWNVGFTPHNVFGFSGIPNWQAQGISLEHAGCLAALKAQAKK